MDINNKNTNHLITENMENIDIKEIISYHLKHKKWYILSIFLCLLVSFIYLKNTEKKYVITSKVMINSKFQQLPQVDVLPDIASNMIATVNNTIVDDQINILKSRDLIREVAIDFTLDRIRIEKTKLYPLTKKQRDIVKCLTDKTKTAQDKEICYANKLYTDNKELQNIIYFLNNYADSTNYKSLEYKNHKNKVVFTIQPINKIVDEIISNLNITPESNKNSFLINIAYTDTNIKRGKKIINSIIESYANKQKSFVKGHTNNNITFIQSRVKTIEKDLDSLERTISSNRINKKIPLDYQSGSVYWNNQFQNEAEINKLTIQQIDLEIIMNAQTDVFGYLDLGSSLQHTSLATNVNKYNSDFNEYISYQNTPGSHKINLKNKKENLLKQLQGIKSSAIRLHNSNTNKIYNYTNTIKKHESEILNTDASEMALSNLIRNQKTKEEVYLYLSKKLEEEQIKAAKETPSLIVIDSPYGNSNPVSPKTNIILLAGFILGVVIPFGVLEGKKILDNTIKNENDFKDIYQGPFIGSLPLCKNKEEDTNDHSLLAESLRIVYSNLQFLLPNINQQGKVIYVTSTIANEGKTFTSFQLSRILSKKKKVLLVGGDVRSPKLNNYFKTVDDRKISELSEGLTNYLKDEKSKFSNFVIKNPDNLGFDFVPSGPIPPNPSELLSRSTFDKFINRAKTYYDLIIVDTAPVGFLVDTVSIAKYADVTIYIARANYLDKNLTKVLADMYKNKKLKNLALLINGVDFHKTYGYKSYAYNHQKQH